MKTYLVPSIVSAVLLLGLAPLGNAAPAHHQATSQAAQIGQLPSVNQQVQAIVNATRENPGQTPRLTAAVILASPAKNAAAIASGVVNAVPGIHASQIAAAIGQEFAHNPALAAQAPQIAAAMVKAILSQGVTPASRVEAARTVAALVSMLPGTAQANHDLIVAIGKDVAAAVSQSGAGANVVADIVGVTATSLQNSSGSSNIQSVINDFTSTFKTADSAFNDRLNSIVANIEAGQNYNALPANPTAYNTNGATGVITSGISSGTLIPAETNTVNH